MHTREEKLEAFGRLLDVLDELREKCPWDKKQTNSTLRTNTIEEVYELCDALLNDDSSNICKELGDVLLHVLFYSVIANEKKQFDIADVCNKEVEKLKFRHPHIYGEPDPSKSVESILQTWEQIKLKEKDGNKTVLSGVPSSLPSLIKAYRIQDKARNVGFDWEQKLELSKEDKEKSTSEFGDFFFSMINVARLYGINPDDALEQSNRKFIHRFNYIEQNAKVKGVALKDMTLSDMDALWNEAKFKERNGELK